MSLRPTFKVQQHHLYLIIINLLFLQYKNIGTKYYTEKYKVRLRSSQFHLRQKGLHCASPRLQQIKLSWQLSGSTLNLNGIAAAHHMSRGRGVPKDNLPAQGTSLAASNILASLTLLHIKWNWSLPPWSDQLMNAPALRVFTVRH